MQLKKNILIVCEGESSEPNYFLKLKDLVYYRYRTIDRINDISIKIEPVPKAEQEKVFQLREGAKRRRTTATVIKDEPVLEEENKSQPKCYVRKAQIIGLESGAYSDVWAVYDKDEHPKHQETVELAANRINNTVVNIGFTSVAFEHWILLHFECSSKAFQKSMCREKDDRGRKKYLFCGSEIDSNDCKGELCVCGKIVSSGYLNYPDKSKDFKFDDYHPNVQSAISNALDLNKMYSASTKPFYEENPYSNLYRLVFKLLHLPIDFLWFDFNQSLTVKKISYAFEIIENNLIVSIINNSETTFIHTNEDLLLIGIDGNKNVVGVRKVLIPGETKKIILTSLDQIKEPFIGVMGNDELIHITEIP